MPYRRLPNTDSARLRAFKKAIEKGKEIPPFRLAFTMKTLVRIQAFLPMFENAISHQRQTLANQAGKARVNQEMARKARLYLSHFLRVMNMAVLRGELPAETRTFYGMAARDSSLPSLATENELVAWGRRIIEGEEYRIRKGSTPVTNPTIAVVKVRYEKFLESRTHYQTISKRASDCVSRTAGMRREADSLITTLWNEIEEHFAALPEEERRSSAERYGLVYVFRKSELARMKEATPTLFSAYQENR